jgi:pyrroloquinoline-quinone synthase
MLNKEQFISAIDKILDQRSILKHPFYRKWNEGKLSLGELQEYAKQYYYFVQNFPMFVSAVHSNCPDPEIRKMLVENIADEDGFKTNTSGHPALWLNFCKSLGISEKEMENSEPNDAVRDMVDSFYALCRSKNFRIGLGALLGYEKQIPEVSKVKIDGLKKCYNIDSKKAIEFFTVHQHADIYHSKAELDALIKSCTTEPEQSMALQSIEKSASYYWRMLDGIYVN